MSTEEFFGMYAMTMDTFLSLPRMECHEDLLERGLIQEMHGNGFVHFISHQWLSHAHPDPASVQLSRMQEVFRSIINGHLVVLEEFVLLPTRFYRF